MKQAQAVTHFDPRFGPVPGRGQTHALQTGWRNKEIHKSENTSVNMLKYVLLVARRKVVMQLVVMQLVAYAGDAAGVWW